MEESSGIQSDTQENKDTITNVNYAPIEDRYVDKQKENDVVADHIISDEKSKQILIQKEQTDHDNNISIDDSLHLIDDALHANDSKILLLMAQDTRSNYSFKGLIRKLNLHQQSLSRALIRLEDMKLIEKSNIGYRLTKNGESLMILLLSSKNGTSNLVKRGDTLLEKGKEIEKRNGYIQLLQTYISVDVKPQEILQGLVGKWFNNLRWVGMIENEAGCYMLQWVSDDNYSFQIILRVISDYLIIETNASSDKEKIEAMLGSYKIFEQIAKILRSKLEEGIGILQMHDLNAHCVYRQNN
ncbi:MAG: LysR family transcriptional regulator [Thermoproteota archaeon]|nr:LysR family transcriptional regulator [Thermoproteota archaeon]